MSLSEWCDNFETGWIRCFDMITDITCWYRTFTYIPHRQTLEQSLLFCCIIWCGSSEWITYIVIMLQMFNFVWIGIYTVRRSRGFVGETKLLKFGFIFETFVLRKKRIGSVVSPCVLCQPTFKDLSNLYMSILYNNPPIRQKIWVVVYSTSRMKVPDTQNDWLATPTLTPC